MTAVDLVAIGTILHGCGTGNNITGVIALGAWANHTNTYIYSNRIYSFGKGIISVLF